MKILLTNDDGYNAPGILTLYQTLQSDHTVVLVAPDREKSAVGHGITLNEPMRIETIHLDGANTVYAVAGTPADCIKLGLSEFFPTPPDLVISGINPGSNTGVNINYSGTVGAAREAALNGIPSMAVSIFNKGKNLDYTGVSRFVAKIADRIQDYRLPCGTFLNINVPEGPINLARGVRITRQASQNVSKYFEKRTDPKNRNYYWYARINKTEDLPGTDVNALFRNYISITPVQCDVTDYRTLSELENIDFQEMDATPS